MGNNWLRRVLSPVAQLRECELATGLMMFAYSFLAMTAYNVIKPITRSKFISSLGADNIPYVQLAAGLLIGVLMQGYSVLVARLPRRYVAPLTLAGMSAFLVGFWFLFRTAGEWVSVGFYLLGLILGLLLISQFWTLANDIYDARQAKRVFGFIGGGSSLGGMTGAGLTALVVSRVGTENLLLCSAGILLVCAGLVTLIVRREAAAGRGGSVAAEEEGVGGKEAIRLLRESRHLQIIALVIAFAAVGAGLIEQQLNMAAEAFKGRSATDNLTEFLAQVTLYLSAIGFFIQVALTSRIHRYLGVGFALLVLPTSLGVSGVVMLLNAALWAPALARILDTSLRYTLDKTTREVLFLPLPTALKYRAKPFVDVTVDRFAKGLSALLALVLIKPWGLGFSWQQISYASLAVMALWVLTAVRARREYLASFRRSIERREVEASAARPDLADPATVEALVEELAHPDEQRVLYAIDLLEALNRRRLVSPLLLHHESEKVRARALQALEAARPELRERWAGTVERLLADASAEVRAAAVHTLAAMRGERAAELMRRYLDDRDPRVVTTAAATLAGSAREEDVAAAEAALERLAADTRETGVEGRRQVAAALGGVGDARFRQHLVPLMFDPDPAVARAAIRSAGQRGGPEDLLVPSLVSLLRHRSLHDAARDVLVGRGEGVVGALGHFLAEPAEDVEVRRRIPATLARIASQKSVDLLLASLAQEDERVRDEALAALERHRREHPALAIARGPVEERALAEARQALRYLSLRFNLLRDEGQGSLLDRALEERRARSVDRVYRLLGLIFPWRDVAVARRGMEGDARAHARAAEYLDNMLAGPLRRWLMPLLEYAPVEEKAGKANALLRTRVRDPEDTLAQLIHDEEEALAAAAIQRVEEKGLWRLADDLEHVLEHRPARDQLVFETASWALAARRISAEARRSRWREALPAVVAAERLGRVPLLRFVSVGQLLRIAITGRTLRPEPGSLLYREGAAATRVQLLLEGPIAMQSGDTSAVERSAPLALGLEAVLAGERHRETVWAGEGAVCLTVGARDLLGLITEEIDVARRLFRAVLEGAAVDSRVLRACRPVEAPGAVGAHTLEMVRFLEASPLFARVTPDQLLQLAQIARAVPLRPGSMLFDEADPGALYIVASGEASLETNGATALRAGPGDTLGVREALAGVSRGRARAETAGFALRLEGEVFIELLAGDTALLQGIFGTLLERSRS
ncbi:MAG TPA: Npt1/Npt2 family nucleotide transporter [Vicinamibacteria bacterium]|nr:Npt1/Npt2 family nucleotide transporter [Vicinamibacteria bacterium]